ncbi:MAG: leucine-rich repeat domain-containing protein [Eubacteriales bacterium]|nr:leucine-rich repeat domain-containing protein [Eubacteriales bacterium]
MKKRRGMALLLAGTLCVSSGIALAAEPDLETWEKVLIGTQSEEESTADGETVSDFVEYITLNDEEDGNRCGDTAYWSFADGTLAICGSGEVDSSPWYEAYREEIETVVLGAEITEVGDLFSNGSYPNLQAFVVEESEEIDPAYGALDGILIQQVMEDGEFAGYQVVRCPENRAASCDLSGYESLVRIGADAFAGCTRLESVRLPSTVTEIEDSAFRGCTSLSDIVIPNKVTEFGEEAFRSCTSLAEIEIPENIVVMGGSVFRNCTSLSEIVIPSGVTKLEDGAFQDCTSLTAVALPDGLTALADSVFSGCSALARITLPDALSDLGAYAFYGCSSLETIRIPEGVTELGDAAFAGCASLESIALPEKLETIGGGAFQGCNQLGSITLPETVSSIGEAAFEGCTSLTVYGYTNSAVQAYMESNNLSFVALNEPPHEHQYEESTITKAATCTEDGVRTDTCSCGATKSEIIPATGHAYGAWVVTTAPTCTDKGEETRICQNDNRHQETRSVDALVHDKDSGTIDRAATCGTEGIKIERCRTCGKEIGREIIPATGKHTNKTTTTKAKPGKNGSIITKCTTCGAVESNTVIAAPKTMVLSKTAYTYNKKVRKPSVTVKDANGKTITASNYTVSYASGRKNVGTYKITVKFKSSNQKYTGSLKESFTIVPKATTIRSVTAASKGFTVKWNKQTTQTTGYQIQYAANKEFRGAKTVSVSKNKTVSRKVKKLKAKKKYYVRLRTYKVVGGKKHYSSWTKSKTVTTKK